MRGLEEYIRNHGNHFTEELAYRAGGRRWNSRQVMDAAQRRTYYNVTGSTVGDMTFLTNRLYTPNSPTLGRKSQCIDDMLIIVGNYDFYGGVVFQEWLERYGKEFDFTPYIQLGG